MLQNERKQYILELINRDRIVRAADLVERLGVSMETIRRDLEELEKAGADALAETPEALLALLL